MSSAVKSPITLVRESAGNEETREWTPQPGDRYLVTGLMAHSTRRFRKYFSSWATANGINLWRGSKWLVRDGKRYLISRTWNA